VCLPLTSDGPALDTLLSRLRTLGETVVPTLLFGMRLESLQVELCPRLAREGDAGPVLLAMTVGIHLILLVINSRFFAYPLTMYKYIKDNRSPPQLFFTP
jgi:hypothetical protein